MFLQVKAFLSFFMCLCNSLKCSGINETVAYKTDTKSRDAELSLLESSMGTFFSVIYGAMNA